MASLSLVHGLVSASGLVSDDEVIPPVVDGRREPGLRLLRLLDVVLLALGGPGGGSPPAAFFGCGKA